MRNEVSRRGRCRRIGRPEVLTYRRSVLEDAIAGSQLILPARRLDGDGLEASGDVKRRDLEGLVAKREESRYVGGRTREWLKVKT